MTNLAANDNDDNDGINDTQSFDLVVSALAALFVQAMDYTLIEMKDMNNESEAARDTFIKEVLEKVRIKINEGFMDEVKVIEKSKSRIITP